MVNISPILLATLSASVAYADISDRCPAGQSPILNNRCCPGVVTKDSSGGTACCVLKKGDPVVLSGGLPKCRATVDINDPDYDQKIQDELNALGEGSSSAASSGASATATPSASSSATESTVAVTPTPTGPGLESASVAVESGTATPTASTGDASRKVGMSTVMLGFVAVPLMWQGL